MDRVCGLSVFKTVPCPSVCPPVRLSVPGAARRTAAKCAAAASRAVDDDANCRLSMTRKLRKCWSDHIKRSSILIMYAYEVQIYTVQYVTSRNDAVKACRA